jgi:hypothetical protein
MHGPFFNADTEDTFDTAASQNSSTIVP